MDTNSELNNSSASNKVTVYRFKFTDEVNSAITAFAKIHQYDDRHDYKDAWKTWMEDNKDLVEDETRRLKEIGYDKDIEDKMFKAGRYYFRKKTADTKKPAKRRQYISIDQTILVAMDEHINSNRHVNDYSPAKGYDSFCYENRELLSREIVCLMKSNTIDADDLSNKIKKTYKNRYFMITRV